MYLKCMFYCLLLVNTYSIVEHNFIIDYFNDKKTPIVVGISCYSINEKLSLFKDFSNLGVAIVFNKINNNTNIHVLAQVNYWKIGIFVDLRCLYASNITSLFFEASESRMFGELHFWLLLVSNLEDVLDAIDDRAFGLSTNVMIAIFDNDTNRYNLYDIYNLSKERGGNLNITSLGSWNEDYGLSVVSCSKLNRRSNLHGFHFSAMFYKSPHKPQNVSLDVYLNDYTHNTIDGQSKFSFNILKHLSEIYNFSLDISETPQWEAGDPRGPMEKGLFNNAMDISGTPIGMSIPRTYGFTYVHQDWPFRTCFIFRNPQPKNMKIGEILRPFTIETWYHMILLFILITTALIFVLRKESFNDGIIKYSNSFLITVGSLCQQGTDIEMKQMSTRIAFLFVLIFSFLVYNFYSASIVSARLDEPIFKINDSLHELGKINLKMASEPMIYFEFFLKKREWSAMTFYENHWLHKPRSEWFLEPEIGMDLVQKGGFAYHTHPDVGYRIIDKTYDNREICELMEVNLYGPTRTAFGVPFNSSIVEITRVGLAKIAEVGIRQRHILRWTFRKPKCRKDVLSASSINIYEFAPHLIFLFVGMVLAINFFLIEIIISYNDSFWKLKLLRLLHKICLKRKIIIQQ